VAAAGVCGGIVARVERSETRGPRRPLRQPRLSRRLSRGYDANIRF
jgi:hypothetical protein